eukprot:TRINITY_DN1890_c1_g1_i1.p1 TRINITY_DN1890_c1_g1~~TRINITY_DN1890_c1_g1_i1.p1  ORF type:complete len:290 (-),score=-7.93 TRINITY_DN1890_c1_g1_i1:258-1127(-)
MLETIPSLGSSKLNQQDMCLLINRYCIMEYTLKYRFSKVQNQLILQIIFYMSIFRIANMLPYQYMNNNFVYVFCQEYHQFSNKIKEIKETKNCWRKIFGKQIGYMLVGYQHTIIFWIILHGLCFIRILFRQLITALKVILMCTLTKIFRYKEKFEIILKDRYSQVLLGQYLSGAVTAFYITIYIYKQLNHICMYTHSIRIVCDFQYYKCKINLQGFRAQRRGDFIFNRQQQPKSTEQILLDFKSTYFVQYQQRVCWVCELVVNVTQGGARHACYYSYIMWQRHLSFCMG